MLQTAAGRNRYGQKSIVQFCPVTTGYGRSLRRLTPGMSILGTGGTKPPPTQRVHPETGCETNLRQRLP